MRAIGVYLIRIVLCLLGCAAVLRFCYGPPTEYDPHPGGYYAVVCGILTLCGLFSWIVRSRRSRSAQFWSSAVLALVVSFALIQLSEWTHVVDGMPWQYFYKDDYIVVFQLIAPITIALLTGALALIPDKAAARISI
jgi:hypothetical protein